MQPQEGQDARHFTGSVIVAWAGGPGLSFQAVAGIDQVDEDWERFWPVDWNVDGSTGGGGSPDGERVLDQRTHREGTVDVKLGWTARLGDALTSELVAGGQWFSSSSDRLFMIAQGFPAPGIKDVQFAGEVGLANLDHVQGEPGWIPAGAGGIRRLGGWFATVGGRLDRTSAFGRDADPAFYPQGGGYRSWPVSCRPGPLRGYRPCGSEPPWAGPGYSRGAFDEATTLRGVSVGDGGRADTRQPGESGSAA